MGCFSFREKRKNGKRVQTRRACQVLFWFKFHNNLLTWFGQPTLHRMHGKLHCSEAFLFRWILVDYYIKSLQSQRTDTQKSTSMIPFSCYAWYNLDIWDFCTDVIVRLPTVPVWGLFDKNWKCWCEKISERWSPNPRNCRCSWFQEGRFYL